MVRQPLSATFREKIEALAHEHELLLAENAELVAESRWLRERLRSFGIGSGSGTAIGERSFKGRQPQHLAGLLGCCGGPGGPQATTSAPPLGPDEEDDEDRRGVPSEHGDMFTLALAQSYSALRPTTAALGSAGPRGALGNVSLEASSPSAPAAPAALAVDKIQLGVVSSEAGRDASAGSSSPGVRIVAENTRDLLGEEDHPVWPPGTPAATFGRDGAAAFGREASIGAGSAASISASETGNIITGTSSSASEANQAVARRSKSSITTGGTSGGNAKASVTNLFPKWFNPNKRPGAVARETSGDQQVAIGMEQEDGDRCVLAPHSRTRMSWDLCTFLCLLYDLWMTPFELVFLRAVDAIPPEFDTIGYAMTAFFFCDILLNFNTGFIHGDHTVMRRREIVKNYLSFWFWVDLIATIPYDLMLQAGSSRATTMLRFGKVSRFVKSIRMVRAMRLVSSMQKAGQAEVFSDSSEAFVFLTKAMQVIVVLCVLAHIHGCIWASLQPDSAPSGVAEAFLAYFQSFWWAYVALTTGSLGTRSGERYDTPGLMVLELVLSSERLVLVAMSFVWGISKVLSMLMAEAHQEMMKEDTLKYLKRHRVGVRTRLQVLYNVSELGRAKVMQRHFAELMDQDLPLELRRTICEELWGARLMSLGLIMHVSSWEEDFVIELAMQVREEVYPSKAVICRKGDAAIAAYYIIRGSVMIHDEENTDSIPDFGPGMWVGEKSLISPSFRRGATVMARTLCEVMVVPSDGFRELLRRLHLLEDYEEFCSDRIWQGLCGRCGLLGEHFADKCPTLEKAKQYDSEASLSKWRFTKSVIHKVQSWTWQGRRRLSEVAVQRNAVARTGPGPEVMKLVTDKKLDRLLPLLEDHDVRTLEDLKNFVEKGLHVSADLNLTNEEEQILHPQYIDEFQQQMRQVAHNKLFTGQDQSREHLIFLSHYKMEAGTEAALMKAELEGELLQDQGNPAKDFDVPIFLDSENLNDLKDLQNHVRYSHNLVLLLTRNVLSRPWVLVEIVTAYNSNVRVLLVKVCKQGFEFEFPDENFYERLETGELLGVQGMGVLHTCGIEATQVVNILRQIFQRIAVPYSPHKAAHMRKAEMAALSKQCRLKGEDPATTTQAASQPAQPMAPVQRRLSGVTVSTRVSVAGPKVATPRGRSSTRKGTGYVITASKSVRE